MVKRKPSQTTLRNTTMQPREELKQLIELVNFIPPEIELPELDLSEPDYYRFGQWIEERYEELEAYLDAIKEQASELGIQDDVDEFCDIFLENNVGSQVAVISRRLKQISDYNNLARWREGLRYLARSQEHAGRRYWWLIPIQAGTTTYFDEQGKIHIELDTFSEAINGIEVSRIRECRNCKRIFWAGKSNQKCCSKRCSNSHRQRNWQRKYKEKYIQQRNERAKQQEKDSKGKRNSGVTDQN